MGNSSQVVGLAASVADRIRADIQERSLKPGDVIGTEGQFAAEIRSKRPPEPYNGKGIKYFGEQIVRKQGKVFGS